MSTLRELYNAMGARAMARAAIDFYRPLRDSQQPQADTRPHRHIVITRSGNALTEEPQSTVGKLLYRASQR